MGVGFHGTHRDIGCIGALYHSDKTWFAMASMPPKTPTRNTKKNLDSREHGERILAKMLSLPRDAKSGRSFGGAGLGGGPRPSPQQFQSSPSFRPHSSISCRLHHRHQAPTSPSCQPRNSRKEDWFSAVYIPYLPIEARKFSQITVMKPVVSAMNAWTWYGPSPIAGLGVWMGR
jgi:hypothetical protein